MASNWFHSDTWCPMPFMSLTIHPSNKLTHCMMSELSMGDIFEDGWDNDRFVEMRQTMLDGKWSIAPYTAPNEEKLPNYVKTGNADCTNCYNKEARNTLSQRQNWLQNQIKKFPEGTFDGANKLKGNNIYHLNLNLSNVCNFKCRMCSPTFSSALIPDFKWLKNNNTPVRSFDEDDAKKIIDVDAVINQYGEQLSELRTIWVTGGEPFMDDRLVHFSDRLREHCDTSNININITTNGSKIDFSILEKLTHYGVLGINLSVDSTGSLFEYMRSVDAFKWEQVDALVEELLEWKKKVADKCKIEVSFNGSYQTYNAFSVFEFYKYFNDKLDRGGNWIEFRLLTHPKFLSVYNMPDYLKDKARAELQRTIDSMDTSKHYYEKNFQFLNNCMSLLDSQASNGSWDEFRVFTAALDSRRNQYLKDYAPELWAALSDEDRELFEKEYARFK